MLDNFDNYFSEGEIKRIAKRVMESPTPDGEREFPRFFERLRKSSEIYSLLMFHKMKLVDFDPEGTFAVVKDQEGQEVKIIL